MLNLGDITAPGWKIFWAVEEETGRRAIHVQQDQEDSHHPGQRWIYGEYFWVGNMNDIEIIERIYTTLQFLTLHELSEQFKVKDHAPFDQHMYTASIARIHDLFVTERIGL